MDRATWESHLKQAERDVVSGERHIAKQTAIICELERLGSDTKAAHDLLATLESLQALHIAHRDRLRAELGTDAPTLVNV